MKRAFWILEFAFVILLTLPIAYLPLRLSVRAGEKLGLLLHFVWGSRRKIALSNLEGALSRGALITDRPAEELVRQTFVNLGKSFAEVVRIYYGRGQEILDGVEIRGAEQYKRAREKGRGVILISGHCGNWEMVGIAGSLKITPANVVARPLNNPYLNRFVERTRQKLGNTVIYKKGALKKIVAALRKNEVVGILIDQSVTRGEGIIIPFLGKNAYTMKMPAMLARKTGAPVLPIFPRRSGTGHIVEFGPEIPLSDAADPKDAVREDTVSFTRSVEDYVRSNPSEWLWIHRRWKRIKD